MRSLAKKRNDNDWFVTHEMGFAKNVSNRVIFMDHEPFVKDRPPKELFEQPEHERTKSFLAKKYYSKNIKHVDRKGQLI